jgi:hypothetical protein
VRAFRVALIPYQRARDAIMEGIYDIPRQRTHLTSIRSSSKHGYLYNCLTILDTKASALLQYDSIILAAATLTLSFAGSKGSIGNYLITASLIISGISSVACLQVVWVYWTLTEEFNNLSDEFTSLMEVRNRRTLFYRIAWILAQMSAFILIVGIIVAKT